MYTKKMYKEEMKLLIKEKGYDPILIGKKAFTISIKHARETDSTLHHALLYIAAMEGGPEFEMTEQEFYEYLDKI